MKRCEKLKRIRELKQESDKLEKQLIEVANKLQAVMEEKILLMEQINENIRENS